MRPALVVLAIAVCWRPAAAQPLPDKPIVDYDQEREEFSEFWERAITPNRELYDQLVAQARALSFESSREAHERAKRILADAIKLEPDKPDALWELGLLHKRRDAWKECAAALEKLFALEPSFRPKGGTPWAFDVELGTCHAQAKNYQRAIRFYKRVLARGESRSVVHRLIGESYMALGQLRRAIEYFHTARRIEGSSSHAANFALAVAYDRDERAASADKYLDQALQSDPTLSRLAARTDFIPEADRYYYLGLGYRNKNAAWSLIYFRHYLDQAPGSVWRSRANYHAGLLEQALRRELPIRLRGSAKADEGRIRAAIAKRGKALAECTRGAPELLLRVKLKHLTGAAGRGTRAGVTVLVDYAFAQQTATVERVVGCVDQVAAEIDLPRLKGATGSYLGVEFPVISLTH